MKKFDFFEDFWESCEEWSNKTFGPPSHRGPLGPLDHLEKERREAVHNVITGKKDIKEFVDMYFLVLDAARRDGHNVVEFENACWEKLEENKNRIWPPWKFSDPNKAIEHDRSKEKIDLDLDDFKWNRKDQEEIE